MPPDWFQAPDGNITQDPAEAARIGATPVTPNLVEANPPQIVAAEQAAASQQAVGPNPIEAEAGQYMRLADLGYEYKGPSAAVQAGYVPGARSGAIPEMPGGAEDRAMFNDQAKEIIGQQAGVEAADAAMQRDFYQQQEMETRQRARQKEAQLAQIDADVGKMRSQLDTDMLEQRRLVAKGVDPYQAMGQGSELAGRLTAGFALGAATSAGPAYLAQTSQLISSMLDREVKMQRSAIEDQGQLVANGYAMLRDRYGDAEQAESALHALLLDGAKLQLEGLMLKNADPRIMLNAQQMMLALDGELQAKNEAFNARAYGNVTERYQQGRSASAGGWRRMSQENWDSHLKSRAGTTSTEAGTAKTLSEIDAAQAEAQRLVSGADAPKDLKGRTKDVSSYGKMKTSRAGLLALAKQMGFDGIDPDTGAFLGEMGDVPGRGVLGSASLRIPGANPEGEAYDRDLKMAVNDYKLAISGQASPEAEFTRIMEMIDSPFESRHRAGVEAFSRAVARNLQSTRNTFADTDAEWLDRHDAPTGANPARFGATVRGGR